MSYRKIVMHIPNIISRTSATLVLFLSCTANSFALIPGHFISGVELGYIVKAGNLTANRFQLMGDPLAGEHIEYITNHGTVYGAFLGYQLSCRNYLLGLETYFDLGRYSQVSNFAVPLLGINTNANLSYYRDLSYGVSARIGYKVKPCFVPYIRIGTQGGEDHFLINYTGLPSLSAWDRFRAKRVNWDWLTAAGLEFPLFSKRVTLRLEYDYLFAHQEHYGDCAPPVEAHYCYRPHAHIVKMQWVWNFC